MTSSTCVIIDYGIGNVFSVAQALQQSGASAELTSDRSKILAADRVILPGVGAFGRAVDTLRELGLDDTIHGFIATERPFLGICVGMQVLMETGYEFGTHNGLGVFSGSVSRIDQADASGEKLRVPIIGWNTPQPPSSARWNGTVFDGPAAGQDFYFVHSFSVQAENTDDVLAVVPVGQGKVVAAVQRDNITGVQFHPERSASGGRAFLDSFLSS